MKDTRSIIAVGDIHGNFGMFGFKIKDQYKLTDTIICLCGDIGIGFHNPNYYIAELKKLNTIAKKGNNLILAVRGNHDNPVYFDGGFDLSNIKLVPDYYVHENDILFIGGGISIDRVNRTVNSTYWLNEAPVYKEHKLKGIKPKVIITHAAPSFCEPTTKGGLNYWIQNDPGLIEDCSAERMVFTKVFDYLKVNNSLPEYWCYGHYHMSWWNNIDGVKFKCCDIDEFFEIRITN